MSSAGSVTHWIEQLKAGEPAAAQELWQRYFHRLVGLARARLQGTPRRGADEEDVALSAFKSFWLAAEHGRFPRLADRDDLWRLLVVITARKALGLVNHERRQKRGGGKVVTERDLASSVDDPALANIIGREPTPEFAAQIADEVRCLLEMLDDEVLRQVALWKMEGYTHEEIAAKLGCVLRTVERKLRVIRGLWDQEIER